MEAVDRCSPALCLLSSTWCVLPFTDELDAAKGPCPTHGFEGQQGRDGGPLRFETRR
jgi:hypothetical protein